MAENAYSFGSQPFVMIATIVQAFSGSDAVGNCVAIRFRNAHIAAGAVDWQGV
jgi:hypothetical protein